MYEDIGRAIREGFSFGIVTHVSPDGDALGSSLGLLAALKELGKDASIYVNDILPENLSFLPNFNLIKNEIEKDKKFDAVFILDCGDLGRIQETSFILERTKLTINIDHHITNNKYGDINLVEPDASSVGEIIYNLLKANKINISKDMSICLYTSILTDTGGFKYQNTTSNTMKIAGDLINNGINVSEINEIVYSRRSVSEVKLMSQVLSTLEMHLGGKLALITMTENMLKETKASMEESEDFINIIRDITSVEVAVFIKEKESDLYRVSLRSKRYADVKDIALSFGGGGHIRAAGCTIKDKYGNAKKMLIDRVKEAIGVIEV